MAGITYVGIAAGGTVSSAFTLTRTDRTVALLVPSLGAASGVFLQFAVTSGGGYADATAVYSGAGPAFGTAPALTRWGRVRLATAASEATSLAVFSVLR